MANRPTPGPRHHPRTLLFLCGIHVPEWACLQPLPLAVAVSVGWGTRVPPHFLYLVSKHGVRRDGSDGLEVEGSGGSLKGGGVGRIFLWRKYMQMK